MIIRWFKGVFRLAFAMSLYFSRGFKRRIEELKLSDCIIPVYDHNPATIEFESYIIWLKKKGFGFASVKDVIEFFNSGKTDGCKVWLTLDDGWKGNSKLQEILEKYEIQVTVFITTSAIESGFFRDSIERKNKDLLPEIYRNNLQKLKDIPDKLRSEIDNDLYIRNTQINRESLTTDEIIALSQSKVFSFQAHTHTHPNLLFTEESNINNELETNISILKNLTGKEVSVLSFPYGRFNNDIVAKVKNFGIDIMVSVESGIIYSGLEYNVLPRNGLSRGSFYENCCRMLDFWYPNTKRVKGIIGLK